MHKLVAAGYIVTGFPFVSIDSYSRAMSRRQYDITIFGATGLTGRHVVEQVFDLGTTQPSLLPSGFQWAVAGRNESALVHVVDQCKQKYPRSCVPEPAIILANVTRRDTVDDMAQQSKTIINAVGPFRFLGEYVVRSCVEQGCDYVDVTGKLQCRGGGMEDTIILKQ